MQHQMSLSLIQHEANGSIVEQRSEDGYINATALCAAAAKPWFKYVMQEENGRFLRALEAKTNIPASSLIQEVTISGQTSVWVHPKVAIHLAQWLSANFAVQVTEWVYDWVTGKGAPSLKPRLPYHIERHMMNQSAIPAGHFSILQEMTLTLIAPLEQAGYTMPERLMPDISQGRMFCKYLREVHGIDTDLLPQYMHRYPDGRVVPAKLYPEEILGEFRKFLRTEWMQKRAAEYFRGRAPEALPFLDKLPALSAPKAPAALPFVRKGKKTEG